MKDVTIIIADIEEPRKHDVFKPYAFTKIYRFDYDGEVPGFIAKIEDLRGYVEGSFMVNE